MNEINLIRAISSEFISRKFKSTVIAFSIVSLIILLVVFWLTTLSAWWWLLAVPCIVLTLLGFAALLVVRTMIKLLRPELTNHQTTSVKEFVDKLERVAEKLQTPMFIIIFRIIRDVIRPRSRTYIQEVTKDSTTLHKDFANLQKDFHNT